MESDPRGGFVEKKLQRWLKESATVQAASVQVAVGGTFEALRSLDGTAQIVARAVARLALVLAMWIARERIRKIMAGLG